MLGWEVKHFLEGAEVDVVEHELDKIVVGEDLEVLEGLVLLVDFPEDLLLVLGWFVHRIGLLLFSRLFHLLFWIHPLIEDQVRVCTPLKHPDLIVSAIIVVIPLLLAAKAFFLEVLNRELLDGCVIKFEPFAVVLRALVALLDETVVVACVGTSRVDQYASQLVLVLVFAFFGLLTLLESGRGGLLCHFSADLSTASSLFSLFSSFAATLLFAAASSAAYDWSSLLGGRVFAVDTLCVF